MTSIFKIFCGGRASKRECKQKLFSSQIFQSQISKPMKFAGKKWVLSRNIQTSEIILNYDTTLEVPDQEIHFINFERLYRSFAMGWRCSNIR